MFRLRQVFPEHFLVPLSVSFCHLAHTHSSAHHRRCTMLVRTAAFSSPNETHRSLPNAALQTQTIYNRTLKFFKTQLNVAASVRVTKLVLHDRRPAVHFPARTRVFSLLQTVRTRSGAHAASCSRCAGRSFLG